MKYLKKISSLSFIILAIFFCCSFLSNIELKRVHAADNNDNIVLNVLKVKKTVKKDDDSNLYDINGETDASTLYGVLADINANNDSENKIDNEEVILLDNETDCVLVTLLPKQDTGYTISSLNASLKINGTIVQILTYSLGGSLNNSVYLQAFDFTSLLNNMGETISTSDMDGLYEFEFTYSYSFYDRGVYKVENGSKTINFYLLNKTEYIGKEGESKINYSNFRTTFKADQNLEQKTTYFYNYNSINPTITFNPSCFNLNIQYSYKDDVVELRGSHQLDTSGNIVGFKLISSDDSVIHDIVAVKGDADNYVVTLSQIGYYDVSYEFVFKNNNELTILNGDKIADVVSNNFEKLSGSNIYIFGYEAYYKDYANALNTQSAKYEHFYTDTIKTDFTDKLTSEIYTKEEGIKVSAQELYELAENHAVTNQAQIKLNDYASLINGYYFFTNNDAFNSDNTPIQYTNSTRFTENGKYVVVLEYSFSKYDELNKANSAENETFVQLIVFEIKNTTPQLELNTGDVIFDDNKLNINGFTNKNVKVSWDSDEDNPFILQPKLIFRKNGTTLSDINIDKKNGYNSVIFTEDGNYTIELRYGLGYNTFIEKTFTIDKSEIKYSILYDFNDSGNYTKQTESDLIVKNATAIKTLNSAFAIQVDKKAIESNIVSATYSYIPFTNENILASNAIVEINGKYYIQNGYELSDNLFENIDYSFVSGSNSVTATNKINANGLYKFILKDKANNQKVIFVFLDNTAPTVLQISETLTSLNLDDNQRDKLTYKSSNLNLISENYSLIFGNGKAISLNNAINLEIVKEFKELDDTEISNNNFKILNYKNIKYTSTKLIPDSENEISSLNENYGIISVTKPESEVDRKYDATLTDYFGNETTYSFEINTDKSLIMIWAKNKSENTLKRILPNSSTNKEEVYIRYQNDYIGSEYEITSLTLEYFGYTANYNDFNTTSTKSFDLLTSSTINTQTVDGITGGYITNSYINAHYDKNALSVTQPGKYILTRKYSNGSEQQYTFYVDRFKPIERVNSDIVIGSNLIFKLEDKNLSGTMILNYINNNQAIKTNFKLKSLPTIGYKYANIEAFRLTYSISYLKVDGSYEQLFSGTNEQYNCNRVFKSYGTYKIKISDLTDNYIEFSLNYSDELIKGNFVTKDNNVISENNACTASNELYFSFETAENDYMYNVDIYNIELYADNLLILKTSKDKTTDYRGTFILDNETIYYRSPYYAVNSNMFKLVREKISTTRYKYTLTILNGDNLNSAHPLYENGQSKELTYRIKLSYTENSSIFTEKVINIDHTSPTQNASKLINSDKFLTDDEKTELLESIQNKDNSSTINFENYVLTTDGNFTFTTNQSNIKETSLIYYRKYDKFATNKTIENYQSLVPGDANFEGTITNRYRFNANLQNSLGQSVYSNIATTKINSPLSEIFGTDYGCYEIIEIDAAENYTIYSLEYVEANKMSIRYQAHETTGVANASANYVEINDVDLQIKELNLLTNDNGNLADFVNITIKKGDTRTLLRVSASGLENQYSSVNDLIQTINSILLENNDSNYGVSYTLTFQGRFGEPIVIAYNEPQEELQLIWQDYENRFVVTIPQSQGATSIKEFNVYPAVRNDNIIVVSETSLDRDSNGQAIVKNATSSTTVGGRSYLFTNTVSINGEQKRVYVYKVVWKDNFGRENSAYKVIGVIDVHELIYSGPTEKINDKIYTFEDVNLRYQMQSYNLEISIKNLDTDEIKENLDISLIEGDANSIANVNVLDYLTQFDWTNNQIEFNITLTSILEENGISQVYKYSFIYYPIIPEVVFTDSSNSELQPAKSTSVNYETYLLTTSKNVTISYDNSIFPVSVSYSLTYVVNDSTFTENYSNVSTETTLTKIGTYIITITNSLGHSVSYRFAIREASLYPYAVIISQLGVQNYELSPSQVPLQLSIDGNYKTVDTYFSIYDTTIEVNADNNLYYKDITDSGNIASIPTEFEGKIKVYLIEPKNNTLENNKIYIAVIKVPYTDDFLMLSEAEAEKRMLNLYSSSAVTSEEINKYSFVVTEKDGARLTLSKKYNTFEGNAILTKIYFNNKLINVDFKQRETNLYELSLTEAGTYDIYFEDFAGNTQLFKGNSFLRVIVLNKVIANLNGENYVDYQVFNTSVYLSVLQANLYSTKSFSISALLNGQDYNKNITSSNGQYVFSQTGLYTVTLKAKYNSIDIETIIHFIIINPNIAYSSFSYAGLNGYTISKIERNNEDVTNDLKVFFKYGLEFEQTEIDGEYTNGAQIINANNIYLNSLNLSSKLSYKRIIDNPTDEESNEVYDYITGSGKYKITVLIDNSSVLSSSTFTFNVWIREENVNLVIKPSIKEGESTTKTINITFNPYLIYSQIGECSIVANDIVLYTINADSVNEKTTINLPEANKTYTVQLKSNDNVEMSFAVTKKEPLSTVSIIVICIASVILAAAIFLFLRLRIKMKVK